MPLISISGEEAFANLRSDRRSVWPDGRRDRVRLSGIADVGFTPGFKLIPGEAVFTAGSCFARNIEQRFGELGFRLPALDFALPAEERASETENDFLNKYPAHSILNEMRWALDPATPFPEDALLRIKRELWHDPHSAPNLKPARLERVLERRRMVRDLYRQIPDCRIVIITLGLVEAWFDTRIGFYLNGAPPGLALEAEPTRFRLDVLTVDDVREALAGIHDILVRFGHPDFRMLLTVSPVPMRNTFTGKDAIVANSYSKSAQRAAVEMFIHEHPRAEYFPSYEIVTLTNREAAYIQDNRHVTPQMVSTIVDRVADAYCPELSNPEERDRVGARRAATEIRRAAKEGDWRRAIEIYADLEFRERYERAGMDAFSYRYEFGRALLRESRAAEAQGQLSQAVALDPGSAVAHYQLGRALARLQRPLEAEDSFLRAVALDPARSDVRLSLANALIERDDLVGAERELRIVLERYPTEERALAALGALLARKSQEPPREPSVAAG